MKDRGRLVIGIRIGESIRIGDATVKFKETRGRIQVALVIEAPLDLKIERITPDGKKARDAV